MKLNNENNSHSLTFNHMIPTYIQYNLVWGQNLMSLINIRVSYFIFEVINRNMGSLFHLNVFVSVFTRF